jgi:hypothetical protein
MLRGGCFCGAVRYETDGEPFHETSCHCSICRRTTGAPFVTWFSVQRATFRFTKGQPTYFRSSPRGERSFCSRCGTQLTISLCTAPSEIDVTTCSLDHPDGLPPKDHTRASSKLGWIKLSDELPEIRESRSNPLAP